GLPQAIFSVVQCVFSLVACVVVAKFAGYDLGYAAGLYSGSQTISAAMGLSTDAINRLGLPPDQAKALLDSMPIAYAVTYMFGTMCSAIVIAIIGPKLLAINLVAACKDYEEKHGGGKRELGGACTAYTRWAVRGVFLRKIPRGATATDIPILPSTEVNRGDLLTLVGRTQDVAAATKMLGVADRLTDVTDMAFVGAAIVVGALIGALVFKVAGVPLTLSTAGGALIAGIIGGWLRSVRPSFGRIPTPTV